MYRNRKAALLKRMESKPIVTVNEICDWLSISAATARRDLERMEREGYLRRMNGGAVLHSPQDADFYADDQPADPYLSYKKAIAKQAVTWIQPGDTVFMDSGSTNNQIAELLTMSENFSVVTNNIGIAYRLSRRKKINVSVCGGTMGEAGPEDSIVGVMAEKMISQYRANLCFMGTSGIHIKHGITDPYLSAARIKSTMIQHSSKVVVVADHRKFGKMHKAFVAPLTDIHHIITDRAAPAEDVQALRAMGIGVTLV
ncbi:MAG: hypothetical protein K0Q59_4167 [Paenibacillus sp.]|nr:hypothetical protein [Paenibacillus sp.]